ncbi:uncharacterized protein L203_104658 [Cryptococcus depauperatus CBS 7841]|uniref:Glycoside hydrolase family 5 domain-containing protein n=1 Tax=Cryptococcus depauperatus CBS 7841 TaxID=1295531 RepID=A0AAJ8JVX4_9TREE
MVKLSRGLTFAALLQLATAKLQLRLDHQASKPDKPAPGFGWGAGPMRGVNIGGWLVLEVSAVGEPDWVVDEWTYGIYQHMQADPMAEIRKHWNGWFKYTELQDIAAAGINTIHWSLIPLATNEPYLVGAYDYLKLAVTWASSLNLKVMVDLHGAPGGQNGFDNSGLRNVRQWFWNDTNISRTLSAIQVLTSEFTQSFYNDTVVAIEVINEPFPYTASESNVLKSFYQSAYGTVRANDGGRGIVVAIDEGFQGLQTWETFMQEPAANTDCAFWLNGRGRGARYDNTLNTSAALEYPGNCDGKTGSDPSKFTSEYVDFLAKSFETQTWVYEQAVCREDCLSKLMDLVGMGYVDMENGTSSGLVDANRDNLWLDTEPNFGKAAWYPL